MSRVILLELICSSMLGLSPHFDRYLHLKMSKIPWQVIFVNKRIVELILASMFYDFILHAVRNKYEKLAWVMSRIKICW